MYADEFKLIFLSAFICVHLRLEILLCVSVPLEADKPSRLPPNSSSSPARSGR